MKKILIIGIGAGNPEYITVQAINALNQADVFFLLDKGAAKDSLIDLRREVCERYIKDRSYRFVEANSPERIQSPERKRGDVEYRASVDELNRDKQQVFEQLIGEQLQDGECGAFLTWGDPALYDSTMRILDAILESGRCVFEYEVIPGISSVQALAARHKIPLNRIGRPVAITTGRRLAEGLPDHADSVVVMLDAEDTYRNFVDEDLQIFWGAYLGTPEEILVAGKLKDVADDIARLRKQARVANGWIMDTYLLRKLELSRKPELSRKSDD